MSTRSTFLLCRASPAARAILVVVFPVPPFWEAMEIIIGINLPKAHNGVFQQITELIIRGSPFRIQPDFNKQGEEGINKAGWFSHLCGHPVSTQGHWIPCTDWKGSSSALRS